MQIFFQTQHALQKKIGKTVVLKESQIVYSPWCSPELRQIHSVRQAAKETGFKGWIVAQNEFGNVTIGAVNWTGSQ